MKGDYRRHGGHVAGSIISGVLIAALFGLVFGGLVMVLWNWLMPAIFGLSVIGYWQGFGLVLLTKLRFGGFGHRWPDSGKHRRPDPRWHGNGHGRWQASDRKHWHNWRFDDVYEDWWEKEGSTSFDKFMKSKEAEKDTAKDEEKKDE